MLSETSETIQGQKQSWILIKKLGEGDAGEVYLVESLLDQKPAIIKRPCKGSFFSDILRQASQIKREGSILLGLSRIALARRDLPIVFPALVDQNISRYELGGQTFIIIEQAKGLDLKLLSQVIRFGPTSIETLPTDPDTAFMLQKWSRFQYFPPQLLVRILLSIVNLLETVHTTRINNEQGIHSGVLWNDVKPEHLYWNPLDARLTVIDWGNSQFLESNDVTSDGQYSALDDFRQFIHEMGGFVSEINPVLFSSLEWPENSTGNDIYARLILPLKEKLEAQHTSDSNQLKALRQQETALYSISRPEIEQLTLYEELRDKLLAYGELPDILGANNFMCKAAYQMAAEFRLTEFQKVCEDAGSLPSTSAAKWLLLHEIADVAGSMEGSDALIKTTFSNALAAGVVDDWTTALWELFASLGDGPRPDWWEKLSQEIRKVYLGLESEAITPYTLFARLYFTLQAEVTRKGSQRLQTVSEGKRNNSKELEDFHWQASDDLVATVREEIIKKWRETEPCPPNSGIEYAEVDSLIGSIDELIPGTGEKIEKFLSQPKAQVDLVLSAWAKKDFELARRGLRLILMWDPDRARLFTAEKAIGAAPDWLDRIRKGAGKEEPFYDYLTSVELAGRSLRNQVGPAKWLDDTLESFKRLRKGTRSVDLLIEYPEIMNELPWINEYQSREIISLPANHPISLDRKISVQALPSMTQGVNEGRFGPDQTMALAEPLDTWMPEARGSSARVFAGYLHNQTKKPVSLAFKIIRPDRLDYALPLFVEEIQILTLLRDVPGITPLVECGFVKIKDGQTLPGDESHASAEKLVGHVIHYGVEQAQNYLASLDRQVSAGWLPYLALVRRNTENNLLRYCDASYTHGWFLPLRDSLVLSLQLCDIIKFAHDRNILYRDHKILHYYWDVSSNGVMIIDWNIGKHQSHGLSDEEKQFDLVQFGARGLHHILTGRPALGSLPLGPNRVEDIENASTHYQVNWTYDDERLPNQLRTFLEQILNQGYTQVRDVRQELLGIYQQLPGTNHI